MYVCLKKKSASPIHPHPVQHDHPPDHPPDHHPAVIIVVEEPGHVLYAYVYSDRWIGDRRVAF